MEKIILVRFGDLVLKGKNKPTFIRQIKRNVRQKLKNLNVKIENQHDRIFVHLNGENENDVLRALDYVAGIHSYSFVYRTEKDLDVIAELAIEIIKEKVKLPASFKVESKRGDKTFPLTSPEISKIIGGKILPQIKGLSVDVRNPENVLTVEIRNDAAYLFIGKIPGLGGFPIGLGGRGLVMLSGGIDSPVAAYLMMKQGIEVELFHFESTPLTPLESVQKVIDISKSLAHYMPKSKIKLHLVPFFKIHDEILKTIDDSYIIIIMRRMMYRLGEMYADKHKILALVNGESVGQVASQTLDGIKVVENVTNLPILRPLITYDKDDIIKLAVKIDTFETSIRPFNDCCSIYVPKSPVTHPKIDKVLIEEAKMDFTDLLDEALRDIITLTIKPDMDFVVTDYGFELKDAIDQYLGENND